jgi:hypothetical protein
MAPILRLYTCLSFAAGELHDIDLLKRFTGMT